MGNFFNFLWRGNSQLLSYSCVSGEKLFNFCASNLVRINMKFYGLFKTCILLIGYLFCGASGAYNFELYNNTDLTISGQFKLAGINEPTNSFTLAPKATQSFSFSGGQIWLCIDTGNSFKTKIEGQDFKRVFPVLRNVKLYNTLIDGANAGLKFPTIMAPPGKIYKSWDEFLATLGGGLICFDRTGNRKLQFDKDRVNNLIMNFGE